MSAIQRRTGGPVLPRRARSFLDAARPDGLCEDRAVPDASVQVRPAREEDRMPLALIFAAVAEERDGIATEPPVDVEARAASWTLEGTLVAVVEGEVIGSVHVDVTPHGFGELGMAVAREWRGRSVGSALLAAAIEW